MLYWGTLTMITNQQNSHMTENNNPYQNAASAYGSMQQNNMSGFEVTAELYKGMIRFVGLAKQSYIDNRLEDMCLYIQKTNKILIALQSNLNFEEGGETSIFLNDLYNEIFSKLFLVLRTENPEESFNEVHNLLKPVAQIWSAHAENAKKDIPDTHIEMPNIQDISEN